MPVDLAACIATAAHCGCDPGWRTTVLRFLRTGHCRSTAPLESRRHFDAHYLDFLHYNSCPSEASSPSTASAVIADRYLCGVSGGRTMSVTCMCTVPIWQPLSNPLVRGTALRQNRTPALLALRYINPRVHPTLTLILLRSLSLLSLACLSFSVSQLSVDTMPSTTGEPAREPGPSSVPFPTSNTEQGSNLQG